MQFCGRTQDPMKADFFYLPIIREVDYRIALQTGNREPSATEVVLLDAIEKGNTTKWVSYFGVTDEFWKKNMGADHVRTLIFLVYFYAV